MRVARPSPAMLVALAGLVGSGDIAPGAIKARHLANGAVTGAKIARGAVSLTRLAPEARPVVVASLPGPQGPAGPAGPPGPAGGFDAAELTTVEGPDVFVPVGAISSATADCGAGRRATGGGFYSSVAFTAASVPGVSSWSVIVWNDTAVDVTVNAYVVCVAP